MCMYHTSHYKSLLLLISGFQVYFWSEEWYLYISGDFRPRRDIEIGMKNGKGWTENSKLVCLDEISV